MPLKPGRERRYVTLLYQRLLNRTPDAKTLDNWVAYMALPQVKELGVAKAIVESLEAKGQGVIRLYQDILKRTPSQAEVISWRDSPYTLQEILAIFLASEEYLGSVEEETPTPVPPGPTPPVPVPPLLTGKLQLPPPPPL